MFNAFGNSNNLFVRLVLFLGEVHKGQIVSQIGRAFNSCQRCYYFLEVLISENVLHSNATTLLVEVVAESDSVVR